MSFERGHPYDSSFYPSRSRVYLKRTIIVRNSSERRFVKKILQQSGKSEDESHNMRCDDGLSIGSVAWLHPAQVYQIFLLSINHLVLFFFSQNLIDICKSRQHFVSNYADFTLILVNDAFKYMQMPNKLYEEHFKVDSSSTSWTSRCNFAKINETADNGSYHCHIRGKNVVFQ